MPVEIKFKNLPAGYAETATRIGEKASVSLSGFFSSEDGDELIKRLEGLPQQIISLIPSSELILPSTIHTLLALIRKDKSATVYLNEAKLIGEVRVKGPIKKGDLIYADHILDMGKVTFENIPIPPDVGIIFVFSVGWRKGFFYDLAPLDKDAMGTRKYDVEALIGSFYSYLMFQERFKIDEKTWANFFTQKWFPFSYLDNNLLGEMISFARENWNLDDLLSKIDDNVLRLLDKYELVDKSIPYVLEHQDILERAIERFKANDYVSCASILYPRIEGLMRSFYRSEGYTENIASKALSKTVVEHHKNKRISYSLLLPEKFQHYLDDVYFAHFVPGSLPDVGRHSVAHGEARSDDFTKKSCVIAILTVYQLLLFFK
jgi:hypothetical protein